MRIAILSDIHGNLTALEAVIKDLHQTAPDLVLQGGDLADSGASPVEVIDRVREFGWCGVAGNTDEIIFRPESLEEFASQSSAPTSLWNAIHKMAMATRTKLGDERIACMRRLPHVLVHECIALVHATPESLWRAPTRDATDAELESAYRPLGQPIVTYGHIHNPYIRKFSTSQRGEMIVANTGSVSLSYDGDRRASYLLLDDLEPTIRRVEYDLEKELDALSTGGLPHADWIARTLRAASPQMP
jgi:putative phosphoesterase